MIKRVYLSFCLLVIAACFYPAYPQNTTASTLVDEQALENLTQNNEDAETEDDTYLQDMLYFIKEPVNLNTAVESDLNKLKILTPLQLHSFFSYRNLLGKFINIYELQAIPYWTVALLRKIKLYVTIANKTSTIYPFKTRFKNGENIILTRVTQAIEKSKGSLSDSGRANNIYPGSPQKLLVRYKYQYKKILQYGITAEKDAGEQFLKGKQEAGFDFYSAHFFVRDLGMIKSLAIGDFTVNLGQGLTQWQGLAFKKGPDVLNTKRQEAVLRPYNSAGEVVFHRGVGITLHRRSLQATVFFSYRKLDANFNADTLNAIEYVSSLQTSGYHRTETEAADKNTQGQFTIGSNLSLTKKDFHIGVNGVHYNFSYPIIKSPALYNKFALAGSAWSNYSVDYSYTFKNLHFFGEAAFDKNYDKAFVNGLLISTDSRVDFSFVYRKISAGYQSLYANAFTESTFPNNESGFYAGLSIIPADAWKLVAYADIYHFPWLKFRVNAPSRGKDYMLQLTYKPNKILEIYSRYRIENKAINDNAGDLNLTPVNVLPKQNWRTQLSYKISSALTFRSRVEVLWYDKQGDAAEDGFLFNTDFIYHPLLKLYSANIRWQYFETDGYNSRLYAYENDILYSFSIPVFFNKGYRYYINLKYEIFSLVTLSFRLAQTVSPHNNPGSIELSNFKSNKKTEFKLQAIINF